MRCRAESLSGDHPQRDVEPAGDGWTLNEGRFPIDSLAVSVNGTDLAMVTDGRTTLRRAATDTGEVTKLATGLTRMLRPQFTRYGEIWTVGRRDGSSGSGSPA